METHEARPRKQTGREMALNNISLLLDYWVPPPPPTSFPLLCQSDLALLRAGSQ